MQPSLCHFSSAKHHWASRITVHASSLHPPCYSRNCEGSQVLPYLTAKQLACHSVCVCVCVCVYVCAWVHKARCLRQTQANIILNSERLKAFPLNQEPDKAAHSQNSHSTWYWKSQRQQFRKKKDNKHLNWKGRSKTVSVYR